MVRIRSRFIIALITFLLGVIATVFLLNSRSGQRRHNEANAHRDTQGLHLIIPDAKWEPVFFGSIDEHLKKVNLPGLRVVILPQDDFEVRFWYDGLPYSIDAVILRRSSDQWSAEHLYGRHESRHFRVVKETLAVPKSGWKAMWEKLVSAGILSLPDASEIRCQSGALDGFSNVVEININRTYRTYRYDNPQLAACNEAKQIISISEVIVDEFGLWNSKE